MRGKRERGIAGQAAGETAGLVAAAGVFFALALFPAPAFGHAQAADPADKVFKEIGVDEKPGARIPPDLVFTDQDGKPVRLGDLLSGKPAILTLNYYTCPMLCPVTLRTLHGGLSAIRGLAPGRDYRVITVSIDPDDTPAEARARAREIHALMKDVERPGDAWKFLVGGPAEIGALTRAAGFRYAKVGREFAHPDASVVVTPEGTVSRYLYGVAQDPADLKLALLEAADGRIGGSPVMNRIVLFCYRYDPVGKKYALYARNVMTGGGALTLVLLGALYLLLWKRRSAPAASAAEEKG